MKNPHLIAELVAADGTSKIQIVKVRSQSGASELQLKQLSWGAGIGWFVQNSVSVDVQQARLLASALNGWVVNGDSADEEDDEPRIIPFPRRS